jgi:hypothetical protein
MTNMKKFIFIILLALIPTINYSQSSVEFTLGAGVTVIDIEKLVEIDEIQNTVAEDWGTANVGISGQYFFKNFGNVVFGGELMYHYLYWYSVRVPYSPSPIFREYSVSTFRITPIFRFGASSAFNFDLGPEINFSNGVSIGILASLNYNIAISENISVPLKLRTDTMFGTVTTIPISINAGVKIEL